LIAQATKILVTSKDITQVLNVYKMYKEWINENTISLILRNISNKMHTLYRENAQRIVKDENMIAIMQYCLANLDNLSDMSLLEFLIVHRKFKVSKFPTYFLTNEEEMRLFAKLESSIEQAKLNPKLISQVFYEYSLLKHNPGIPLEKLKIFIDMPD
jgi:hypothetical protein